MVGSGAFGRRWRGIGWEVHDLRLRESSSAYWYIHVSRDACRVALTD